jgi:VanZ family protein
MDIVDGIVTLVGYVVGHIVAYTVTLVHTCPLKIHS